jgi:uncharacterized membrane protein (DUF2068 family)
MVLIFMSTFEKDEFSRRGIRIVSLFEGAKGLLVLLVGFGLFEFIHKDLHSVAVEIVRHFHLNPARHYSRVFIEAASHLTDGQLWVMACAALLYSVLRFIEAVGLWFQRKWAEWFGLLTGGIYIPVELLEIMREVTFVKVTVFMVNAAIVGYLAFILYRSGKYQTVDR